MPRNNKELAFKVALCIFVFAVLAAVQDNYGTLSVEAQEEAELVVCVRVAEALNTVRRCDLPNGDVCYTYGETGLQCKFSE